nr:hypothetical protein CFP56_79380 [Quercus suber]
MVRGLGFTAGLTVLIALVLLVPPTNCSNPPCAQSSSCGNITNIRFPFRLKTDPKKCGSLRYELSCENNRTVLNLFGVGGKYYVQEISYNNYTIRIVDSSIRKDNYFSFSTPTYSLSRYYTPTPYYTYLQKGTKANYRHLELSRSLALMSCEKPVNSPLYLDISTCNYHDNSSSISDSKRRYRYVKVGRTNVSEVEDSCQVKKMFLTSRPTDNDHPNISCTDVLNELAYGFEISWLGSSCYLDDANHVQCDDSIGLLYRLEGEVSFSKSCLKGNIEWIELYE